MVCMTFPVGSPNFGNEVRPPMQAQQALYEIILPRYQRQDVYDRLATSWSQTIRGVDEYYNPIEERPVELPGGYNYAWTNSLGKYTVTESPSFGPNIGSNLTWQLMERRP